MIQLSLVIATNNRPVLLDRLMKSIVPQKNNSIEIIIIPNSDGLAKARNLGWRKSRGQYIAYIDDDAVLSKYWVKECLNFIKNHPEVMVFGGPYTSLNQAAIPRWIPSYLTTYILHGPISRPIDLGLEWLTGTNMVFSKAILKKVNGFNEKLGVVGNKRSYGEETDILIRIHNLGYPIWYDPKLTVLHEFAKHKQSLSYLLIDQYTHGYNSLDTFKHLRLANPKRTANLALTRILSKQIPLQTRIYYLFAPAAYLLGKLKRKFT